jgi:hypothetical protein
LFERSVTLIGDGAITPCPKEPHSKGSQSIETRFPRRQPITLEDDFDEMSSALQKFSGARSRWEDTEDFVSDVESVIGTMARIYPMTEEEINREHVSTFRRNLEGPAAD